MCDKIDFFDWKQNVLEIQISRKDLCLKFVFKTLSFYSVLLVSLFQTSPFVLTIFPVSDSVPVSVSDTRSTKLAGTCPAHCHPSEVLSGVEKGIWPLP